MWCASHVLIYAGRTSTSNFLGHGLGFLTRIFGMACIKRPIRPTTRVQLS